MATLTVSRRVRAVPPVLWPTITSVPGLRRWWWPHLPDTQYQFEPHPQGGWFARSAQAGIGVRGVVLEVDEPRSLVLTWEWEQDGGPVVTDQVLITIDADGPGSLVTVQHTMASPDNHDGYRQGWIDVLNRLAELEYHSV